MEETIVLSFRYTEEDYVRAMRAHYYQQMKRPLDLVVIMVSFAAGINLWAIPDLHWLGVACVSVVVVYWLMLAYAYFVLPKKLFRQEPKLQDQYDLDFSSAGIGFRTVNINSQISWSIYTRALINEHSYNLYYGPRSITIIPKRVLANPQQQEDFERLLGEKIPKISRKRV